MKKIEMYLSNDEYSAFLDGIHKFHEYAEAHEKEFLKFYSDEERAEILNACEAVPFYVRLGIHLQMDAMDRCLSNKAEKKEEKQEKEEKKHPEAPRPSEKPAEDPDPKEAEIDYEKADYEVEEVPSDSGEDFDYNF